MYCGLCAYREVGRQQITLILIRCITTPCITVLQLLLLLTKRPRVHSGGRRGRMFVGRLTMGRGGMYRASRMASSRRVMFGASRMSNSSSRLVRVW